MSGEGFMVQLRNHISGSVELLLAELGLHVSSCASEVNWYYFTISISFYSQQQI